MKNKNKIPYILILSTVLITSCSSNGQADRKKSYEIESQVSLDADSSSISSNVITKEDDTKDSEESLKGSYSEEEVISNWKELDYTEINLNESSQTITSSGIYLVSGDTEETSLIVNVDQEKDSDTVYIILNGVNMSSSSTAPINIEDAEKVVIIAAEETENNIIQSNIETNDEEFPSAAIYSTADLLLTGQGTLNVETQYNDGIKSKDSLDIEDLNLNVTAIKDGIVVKDKLEIDSGNINIKAGKDGLKGSDDTASVIEINGGNIKIENSDEGIEAFEININGSDTKIYSTDDGINAKTGGIIRISGGNIYVEAGGDGLDSNGSIEISGATTTINTSTIGQIDTPIDADGSITVSGGKLIDENGQDIDYENMMMGPGMNKTGFGQEGNFKQNPKMP